MDFDESNPISLIFIITNYEDFYRDPVANGEYKYVERELLERNWVDRNDLIFTWEYKEFTGGLSEEAPIVGSEQEATGALLDLIDTLQANVP